MINKSNIKKYDLLRIPDKFGGEEISMFLC